MNRTPHCVAAFTLIEMMISIALGSLIVYTAFAGFRIATQTIAVANRLSNENSLLRAGYFEAQNQLDFWTNIDDPSKSVGSSDRPLTMTDNGKGMPFTPMSVLSSMGVWQRSQVSPASGTGTHMEARPSTAPSGLPIPQGIKLPSSANVDDPWEKDTGFDPGYTWSPHDPRTWWRGNMAEKDRPLRSDGETGGRWLPYEPVDAMPPMYFGRYGIFAHTNPGSALAAYKVKNQFVDSSSAADPTIDVTYTGYPSDGIHSWYYKQVSSLTNAMGYAALCEYLPPNAIYAWYTDNSSDTTWGGMHRLGLDPGRGFCNGDGNQRTARGIYRQTYATSYGYFNPRAPDTGQTSNPSVASLRDWHYKHYSTDYGAYVPMGTADNGGVAELKFFIAHINYAEPLMPIKPAAWPEIQVSVGRLIKNAHHLAVAKVSRFSALTGEAIELSWCGLGTTLRGARQQRLPSGIGWAHWDDTGTTNDPTLDSP